MLQQPANVWCDTYTLTHIQEKVKGQEKAQRAKELQALNDDLDSQVQQLSMENTALQVIYLPTPLNKCTSIKVFLCGREK